MNVLGVSRAGGWGEEKKIKDILQQREGQEKYLIQTMNIVISSHSLHSQSTSLGKLEEPRMAGLSASPARARGGRDLSGGHAATALL